MGVIAPYLIVIEGLLGGVSARITATFWLQGRRFPSAEQRVAHRSLVGTVGTLAVATSSAGWSSTAKSEKVATCIAVEWFQATFHFFSAR